ncbi:MAG TPA: hypothetical protein VFJ17_03130 [Mycobacteriales bacterium]|jgi:hypothetical protein|nr:hypothetical protein [Mycobacteriales bacterium]
MSEGRLPAVGDLPDRQLFWRWVWGAVRPVVGWVLAALGGLALLLGWYGVSGQALTAKQLPYLVSGGLTGIGLLVLAAVFLATEDVRRQLDRLGEVERKVDALYGLFAADLADPTTAVTPALQPAALSTQPAIAPLALPTGSSYHRPGCALVTGKADAEPVDAATATARGLRPCRVCDPDPLG